MAMDVSTLSVRVESKGIDVTTKSLEGLEKRAATTESAVVSLMDKLSKSSSTVLSVVQSMNQLRAAMQGALPNNAISASLSDFKKMSEEIKSIQSMMGKGVGGNISVTIKEMGNGSKEAVKGVESLNQSLSSGQNVMQAFGKELYHIRNLLGGTMLAGALINTAQATVGMADSWVLLGTKLKMQLSTGADVVAVQNRLVNSSLSMKVPLESMVTLYSRLIPAMKDFGVSADEAMKVTETMAAALKVSGATGAETASVMLQFSQSMAAGRLNGAEFNAVAEGAPIILRMLSKELGVTRGELKKMASEGQLSTDIITIVMDKYHAKLTAQAKAVPETIGASFQYLETQFTRFAGTTNESLGITTKLAVGIKALADSLDILGKALAAIAIGAAAAALVSFTASAVGASLAAAQIAVSLGIAQAGVSSLTVSLGVLDIALQFVAKNPLLIVIGVLAGGAYLLYDAFNDTTKSAKDLNNALANAKGIADAQEKMSAYVQVVKEAQLMLGQAQFKLDELLSKKSKSTSAQAEFYGLSEEIKKQQIVVKSLEDAWRAAAKTKEEYSQTKAFQEQTKQVNATVKDLEDQIAVSKEVVRTKEKLTGNALAVFQLEKKIAKARADGIDPKIIESNERILAITKEAAKWDKLEEEALKSKNKARSGGEPFEKKYQKEIEGIQAFINKQGEELGLTRKLTEAEKESLKISEFISANRAKLSVSQLAALNVKREAILTNGLELEAQKDLLKVQTEAQDKYYKERSANLAASEATRVATETLQRKIDLQSMANAGITETSLGEHLYAQAVNASALASINKAIATEQEAKALEQKRLELAASEGDVELAKKAITDLNARVEALQRQKDVLEELIPLQDKLTEKLIETSKKSMLDIGRSPGQILADGFGEAGAAISKMSDAYKAYTDDRIKLDKYVADQVKAQQKFGPPDVAKIDKEVAAKRIQISAGMYASMAGAAKGFFTENSRGYQAMAKAEKAFRAIELALAIKNNAQKLFMMGEELAMFIFNSTKALAVAIETSMSSATAAAPAAVANAAQMPGPLAFVGAAAMIALLAGLGIAIAGGGGGSSPDFKAERQAAAGKGSVFGDTGAKSESLSKALENISANSEIANQYNEGMLNALKNIESSLTGLAKITLRSGIQTGVRDISGMGTTKLAFGDQMRGSTALLTRFFDPITARIGVITNALFTASIGVITNALFSVKKSVVDSGILQQAQTLESVMQGGTNISGYATIETKSKKWGKTKTSTEEELTKLSDDIQKQFTMVITGMAGVITESAKVLNLNSDEFTKTLNSFVVDLGHISLHDLSGEQIQEQFAAIFSKMGDDMAKSALPMLEQFQNVGEGYLETLIRVTSAVATVDGIFKTVGTTFGQVGLAGVEAKMHLIDLAGGLDKLSGLVSGFFEKFYTDAEQKATLAANVSQKLISLGITGLDVTTKDGREAFRRVVEQYKDTNSEVFIELLKLSDSVDKLAPAFADTASAADIAASKLSMDIDLLNLQGKSIEAVRLQRERELATLDDSLKPIQQLVWTLSDLKAAASTSLSGLEKSVSVEKTNLKTALDAKLKVLDAAKTAENSRYEAEKNAIQDRVDAANVAIDLENKAKDARADSLKIQLDALKESRDNIKTLFDDIASSIDTLTGSVESLNVMSYQAAKNQLDSTLAIAKATGKLPDPKTFKDILTSITSVNADSFSSAFDLNREKLVSAGKLTGLQSITGDTLSNQELAIKKMEDTIKAIEDSKQQSNINAKIDLDAADARHKQVLKDLEDQQQVLKDQYEVDVFYLDGILVEAKKQLDIANGTYTATLGVKDAVVDFATKLAAYVAQQDAKNADMANQLAQMAIGTIPTLTAIAQRSSDDNAALTQQVKDLQDSLAAANRAIAENTKETAKVLSRWDGDGQPEVRNVA